VKVIALNGVQDDPHMYVRSSLAHFLMY